MKRNDFAAILDARGYKTAAEIGVAWGAYSVELLANSHLETLYCVDNWAQRPRNRRCRQPWGIPRNRRRAVRALRPFGVRAHILWMESGEAAEYLTQRGVMLDFVYVDASHAYADVKRDIELWWPLVRAGGILAGHDYDPSDLRGCRQVMQAVDQFLGDKNLILFTTNGDQPAINESWFVNKPLPNAELSF